MGRRTDYDKEAVEKVALDNREALEAGRTTVTALAAIAGVSQPGMATALKRLGINYPKRVKQSLLKSIAADQMGSKANNLINRRW